VFEDMKRFRTPEAPPVDAARLGEELRDARLALGASIEDMAAQLRIRRVYLIALEEGRLKDLPSPAYAIGFVRNYAGALGLDVNDMVRRFREAASGKRQDLVFPEPVPERGFPAGVLVLLGAAVAIGSYITWYNWTGSGDRTVDAVPPPPPRLESAVREGEALRPEAPGAPAPQAAAPPSPSLPVPTPVPVQVPAPPAPAQPPAAAAGEGRMVIRARAEAWVQVRDPRANQNLLARVMRPGESWSVPTDRTGLLLSTGAAQNIDVLVDGQVSQVFAATQGVRRDVPLNPAELRNRPPAPAPAAPAPAAPAPAAARPSPPAAPPAPPAAAPPAPARLQPAPAPPAAAPPAMGRP
jgi:cytoskeleton protein RodZ